MQAVSFFRAAICNSSYSAFKLVLENPKNIDFARKVIMAKNESAYNRLSRPQTNRSECLNLKLQTMKYNSFLKKINYISGVDPLTNTSFYFSNISDFKNNILINQ